MDSRMSEDENAKSQPQPARIARSALLIHGLSLVATIVAFWLLHRSTMDTVRGEPSTPFAMGVVGLAAMAVLWPWSMLLAFRSISARENPDIATLILAAAGIEFVVVMVVIG
jgi:hypothetical protein